MTDEKHQSDLDWLYDGAPPPPVGSAQGRPPAPVPAPPVVAPTPVMPPPVKVPPVPAGGTSDGDFDWLYGRPAGDAPAPVPVAKPSAPPPDAPADGAADTDFDWLYGSSDPAPAINRTSARQAPPQPVAPPAPAGRIVTAPAPRVPVKPNGAFQAPPQPETGGTDPAGPGKGAPPSDSGLPPAADKPAKPRLPWRKKLKRIGLAILLVLALWVSFLIYAPLHAWNAVPIVDDMPAGDRPPDQPGTAILLVGTDSRDDLTPEEQAELGTGGSVGSRTDVMMIYYVPPSGRPALISLPRDSYLPIPGHGKNKLNAAYAFGGAPLLIQTVENATGLRIDGYLEIGFGGFVQLVDAVGGIEVCLDKPMTDQDAHIDLPAGCQTLDGVKALGYVRQRHQDPRGDLGRVDRQRQVIGQVLQKLATPATVLNPVRYWRTCQAITAVLTKGQDTGLGVMKNAAIGGIAFAKGQAISLTVPIGNPNASTPAGSSVLWDDAKAQTMFAQIAQGDTSQLDQFVR